MNTNTSTALGAGILKSHLAKQIMGACVGMTIAAGLYMGLNQISNLNIQGLLVSTETVSENSGEVSVNNKNVDESTLRRISANAARVAAQLTASSAPAQPDTPITQHAAERRATRQFVTQVRADFENAPTYVNDPNAPMTEDQRNAIRAARVRPQFAEAPAAEPVVPLTFNNPPEETEAAAVLDAPQGEDGLHSAADAPVPSANGLPDSGLGLNILILSAILLAFALSKTTWRMKAASLISRVRIV